MMMRLMVHKCLPAALYSGRPIELFSKPGELQRG